MPLLTNRNSILEALRTEPLKVTRLWVEAGHERSFAPLLEEARKAGIPPRIVSREEFAKRFRGQKFHLCLEMEEFSYTDQDELLARVSADQAPLIAAFDGIFDPQNLGNVIRSAACLGVDGIILPKDRSTGVTETVTNVSRGGTAHVRIARVTNLHRYLTALKERNLFCFGLDERGDSNLWELDLTVPLCLVFGTEEGLRRLTRATCDAVARIPTSPRFAALNVASTFAIALYEAVRQRKNVKGSRGAGEQG